MVAGVRLGVAHRLIAGLGVLAMLTVLAVGVAVYGAVEFRRGFDHIALTRLGHLVAYSKLAQQSQIVAASAPRLVAAADRFELTRQTHHIRDLFVLLDAAFAELEASGAGPAEVEPLTRFRPAMDEALRNLAELVAERHDAERAIAQGVAALERTANTMRREQERIGAALTADPDPSATARIAAELDALRTVTSALNAAVDAMLPVVLVPIPAMVTRTERETALLLEAARAALAGLPPDAARHLAAVADAVAAQAAGPQGIFELRRRQLAIAARTQGLLARNNIVAGQFVSTVSRRFAEVQAETAAERQEFGRFVATAFQGLLAIGGVAVAAAALVVLYVRGRLLRRLLGLRECMTANAAGQPVPVPVAGGDEIADMGQAFRHFVDAVALREAALAAKSEALEAALASVDEGTRYARRIQRSLLPPPDAHGGLLGDVSVIWHPLDTVGGDCYWIGRVEDLCVVALMDCTGHGVPGAVMTAIATSALARVLQDGRPDDPVTILERLDATVRAALRQDGGEDAEASDDGLDAAICIIDPAAGTLSFAGANLPMLYRRNGVLHLVKGARAGLGYRSGRRAAGRFRRHDLPLTPDLRVFLFTDGVTDHVGGPKRLLFGRRRLQETLATAAGRPLDAVADHLLATLDAYRGEEPRRDDLTFVAFAPWTPESENRMRSPEAATA